ncbi:MAG: putative lipoprotein [Polaromonas sp.]|jgi:uncharacterized cupredoxin-like copper-binding protein|nr:putative lipoprotein [Polaromonas sp.]
MTYRFFNLRLAAVLTGAALATACASSTPVADASFGDAVRSARMAQTLYPNAPANRNTVLGIDGKAGAAAQERYQDSFKAPPKTFEVINIGGSLNGN